MTKTNGLITERSLVKDYIGEEKNVAIPDGITMILAGAFHSCDSIEKVTIPDSVTDIFEYAFFDCDSLKEITIPNSVTWIGEDAFSGCDSLTIHCNSDSVAHKYALKNNIKVVLLKEDTTED